MEAGKTKLKLPQSTRDILELFTLSRTNQILRGRSPILPDLQDEDKKGWTELVASEIFSAQVDVVSRPQEMWYPSTDPRRGRYEVKSPQRHLCKAVRNNLLTSIFKKYNLGLDLVTF